MEHIVVTGGAGFVGSNLVIELRRRHPACWITVLDDFRSGCWHNLAEFRGDVVAVDVSRTDLDALFERTKIDAIVHLASITDTTVLDQRLMVHDNVEGFRRVLALAQDRGVRLVYASSAAIYGICGERLSEERPPAPANPYAFSKWIIENLARRAAQTDEFPIVGLRYFNVYGPREAHKGKVASMICRLAAQMSGARRPRIFRHGEQKRDFVYVADVVGATLAALNAERSGVYNVGTGTARSFNEVVAVLNENLGSRWEPEYIDNPYPFYQPFTEADTTRLKKELNYTPGYALERGVAEYVSWMKDREQPAPSADRLPDIGRSCSGRSPVQQA